jgi:hypothetical protein
MRKFASHSTNAKDPTPPPECSQMPSGGRILATLAPVSRTSRQPCRSTLKTQWPHQFRVHQRCRLRHVCCSGHTRPMQSSGHSLDNYIKLWRHGPRMFVERLMVVADYRERPNRDCETVVLHVNGAADDSVSWFAVRIAASILPTFVRRDTCIYLQLCSLEC